MMTRGEATLTLLAMGVIALMAGQPMAGAFLAFVAIVVLVLGPDSPREDSRTRNPNQAHPDRRRNR